MNRHHPNHIAHPMMIKAYDEPIILNYTMALTIHITPMNFDHAIGSTLNQTHPQPHKSNQTPPPREHQKTNLFPFVSTLPWPKRPDVKLGKLMNIYVNYIEEEDRIHKRFYETLTL